MKLAIVGAGWAGMAAAVAAAQAGADVTVLEATRETGGRARALAAVRPDGVPLTLDNGQHILIGAYSETLALMQRVGVHLPGALMALPLGLPFPDGMGLQTPAWAARWPAPLDALTAIATARGWRWGDRLALIRASLAWQRAKFVCDPQWNVSTLCQALPARVMDELIEPLCVSALNLPAASASAQVFLRVMQDALFGKGFGGWAASSLLLPRDDLSALFPAAAQQWLQRHHGQRTRVHLNRRVRSLERISDGWRLHGDRASEDFDRVIWATSAGAAARVMTSSAAAWGARAPGKGPDAMAEWARTSSALSFTAITTVYAWAPGVRLAAPMLALRPMPGALGASAQFVFDRGQLRPDDASAQGVLAFVVSASEGERGWLQQRVLQQGQQQLGLPTLQPIQTVTEKRATFACTPGLNRPQQVITGGLWAAGDHVQGPYPATLEAAVRSGLAAARMACAAR